MYSPFFSLKNAVCFIILTYLVPVLFTFYILGVLKLKSNSDAKRLSIYIIGPSGNLVKQQSYHKSIKGTKGPANKGLEPNCKSIKSIKEQQQQQQ